MIWLLAACAPDPLDALPTGPVAPRCAALADGVSPKRLMADVTTLASAPRASVARRAEARAWLAVALGEAGLVATEEPFTIAGQSGVNVTAGAGPVLVAAHYDSTDATPGADDNASGVAVTLAVARALGPKARYAFFDVEEPREATVGRDGRNYAFGSQAYADALPDGAVAAAFVIESVGYACDGCQKLPPAVPASYPRNGRGVYLVGSERAMPMLARAVSGFGAAGASPYEAHSFLVGGTGRGLPQSRFSDNAPLWDRGIAAVLVTDTALLRNPHYHKATDTSDTLDPTFLTAVAKGAVVTVGSLVGACPG